MCLKSIIGIMKVEMKWKVSGILKVKSISGNMQYGSLGHLNKKD